MREFEMNRNHVLGSVLANREFIVVFAIRNWHFPKDGCFTTFKKMYSLLHRFFWCGGIPYRYKQNHVANYFPIPGKGKWNYLCVPTSTSHLFTSTKPYLLLSTSIRPIPSFTIMTWLNQRRVFVPSARNLVLFQGRPYVELIQASWFSPYSRLGKSSPHKRRENGGNMWRFPRKGNTTTTASFASNLFCCLTPPNQPRERCVSRRAWMLWSLPICATGAWG